MSSALPSDRRRFRWVALAALLFITAPMVNSCGEVFDGPSIFGMTISPAEIPETDTGMTDQYFSVEIVTSGFTSEFQGVEVFIQDPYDRPAPFETDPVFEGDQITIDRIPQTWFRGIPPGTYQIGATVESEEADITERNLTTVTVTASN